MARIPLPERGQPLDLSYIYQIANAVNEISNQISTSSYGYASIDTISAGRQSLSTADAKVVAGYIDIVNNSTVSAGNERTFSYEFPTDFKYAPIATATAINIGNTPAGKNVSVVLKSVTTSRVEGVVRFNTAGDVSIAVNLIVVGVPN